MNHRGWSVHFEYVCCRFSDVGHDTSRQRFGSVTLAYGVCVGPSDKFERFALPGIQAVDPGAPILVRNGQRSIFEAYNSMIDEAILLGVDGLVLIHDDVLLRDIDFASKVGSLLVDPTIGIVGAIGASDIKSVEWWWYETRGTVEEIDRLIDFGRGTFDVDVVDGLLIAMSPSAMRQLRFDEERFTGFHGYDVDIGMQAKHAGLRVVVTDLDVFHDTVPGRITDRSAHLLADQIWRRKWRRSLSDRLAYIRSVWTSSTLGKRDKTLRLLGRAAPMVQVMSSKLSTIRRGFNQIRH